MSASLNTAEHLENDMLATYDRNFKHLIGFTFDLTIFLDTKEFVYRKQEHFELKFILFKIKSKNYQTLRYKN